MLPTQPAIRFDS